MRTKPGPKNTKVPGYHAVAFGKRFKFLLSELEPLCDGRSLSIRKELSTLANWLDGSDRSNLPVQPYIAPKPIKAKKRRAYSARTQATISAIGMRLDAGEPLPSACKAEGVERPRFERYMIREGYGAVIERNARALIDRQTETNRRKAAKPKPQIGRATFLPARG